MPGRQADLAVALEGVGGQRHDRQVPRPLRRSRARISAVASKPSISGIWQSIRTRS